MQFNHKNRDRKGGHKPSWIEGKCGIMGNTQKFRQFIKHETVKTKRSATSVELRRQMAWDAADKQQNKSHEFFWFWEESDNWCPSGNFFVEAREDEVIGYKELKKQEESYYDTWDYDYSCCDCGCFSCVCNYYKVN